MPGLCRTNAFLPGTHALNKVALMVVGLVGLLWSAIGLLELTIPSGRNPGANFSYDEEN
jgi:hypothetical protein